MAPKMQDTQAHPISQADFQTGLRERLRAAVRVTLVAVLEEEVENFVGAGRYQRTPWRRDHRNGHYLRDLGTGLGVIEDLAVPRTRQGFETQVFERYARRQAEVDHGISEMFVRGVSTRGVGEVFEQLTGAKPSASTVSRVFHTLEEEYNTWKGRPLAARYLYAFADGTYFSVIYDAVGCKMPILAVMGITEAGEREVLAFSVGDRENQKAWEELFEDLKRRGLQEIGLWVTDGHQAMLNALAAKFGDTPRQRCIKHKLDNVLGYVPEKQRDQVEPELKAIFYQDSRQQADELAAAFDEKFAKSYPSAVACLKRDLDACLTFYAFPKAHWKTIRTTNVIERLFDEVKRRSHKMAAAFRNEDSCLLMFYAVVRSLKFKRIPVPAKPAT
jgi:transposase-like protein